MIEWLLVLDTMLLVYLGVRMHRLWSVQAEATESLNQAIKNLLVDVAALSSRFGRLTTRLEAKEAALSGAGGLSGSVRATLSSAEVPLTDLSKEEPKPPKRRPRRRRES